jgi:hypothetical protein
VGRCIVRGQFGQTYPGMANLGSQFVFSSPYTFQGAQGPLPLGRVWPVGILTGDNAVGNGSFAYPNGPDGRGYIDRVLLARVWASTRRASWVLGAIAQLEISHIHHMTGKRSTARVTLLGARSSWRSGETVARVHGTVAFCIETSDTWYVL